ncbi:MAG: serine acetyltransferase [Paludibacteraceae bacterium]|nr:serine acetyltransferase [Paludibacteraceae bacterium]
MPLPTDFLLGTAQSLATVSEAEQRMLLRTGAVLPSPEELQRFMQFVRAVVFPGFYDQRTSSSDTRLFHTGVAVEQIYSILCRQIARGFVFCREQGAESGISALANSLAERFVTELPEIKRLVLTDVEAVALRDPAVSNYGEVVLSYPCIMEMLHHRTAHALYRLGVPVIPRMIAEQAHSLTGIDIHPAAQIGEYFSIDHGTGVVIGETTVIGNRVMLYQGVTLGAKNFQYDSEGRPMDLPRHPVIEDRVTIYSNASILGRVRIGHDSVIGGNVWITRDVPPGSRITQSGPVVEREFADGSGI